MVFHYIERAVAELGYKLLRGRRTYALDSARGQIAKDVRCLGRAAHLAGTGGKLSSVAFVLGKNTCEHYLVARACLRHNSYGGNIILAVGNFEHGVAVLVISVYDIFHNSLKTEQLFLAHSVTFNVDSFDIFIIILYQHLINQVILKIPLS